MFDIGQKFKVVGDFLIANFYDENQDYLKGRVLTIRSSNKFLSVVGVDEEEKFVLAIPTKEFQELVNEGVVEEC